MKLLIVAALMFPFFTAIFAVMGWRSVKKKKKYSIQVFIFGMIVTLALYGILYLLFGD